MGMCNACVARDDGRSRRRVEAHVISGYVLVSDNGGPWRKVYAVLFSNSNLIWYSEKRGEPLDRIKLRDMNSVMSLLMVGPACRRIPSCPDQLPRKVSYDYMIAIPQNYRPGMEPHTAKILFLLLPNARAMGNWMKAIRSRLGFLELDEDHSEDGIEMETNRNNMREVSKRKKRKRHVEDVTEIQSTKSNGIPKITEKDVDEEEEGEEEYDDEEDYAQAQAKTVKRDAKGFFGRRGIGFGYREPWEYGWGWGWGADPTYGHGYKDFDRSEDYDDKAKTYQGDSHSVESFGGSDVTDTSDFYGWDFMPSASGFAANDVFSDHTSIGSRAGGAAAAAVSEET